MAPTVDGLEKQYQGKVSVRRVNANVDYALAQKFNLKGVPTYVFLSRSGAVIETVIGGNPIGLELGFLKASQ